MLSGGEALTCGRYGYELVLFCVLKFVYEWCNGIK